MRHKHRWNIRGIITEGHRTGMTHRMCKCGAELYEKATPAELRKHDPDGTIKTSLAGKDQR